MADLRKETEPGKLAMITCLLVCTLTNTPIVISPIMGALMGTFKAQGFDASTIKLVLTLPKLTCLIFTLVSVGFLVDRIDNKWLGVLGVGGIGVFGLSGVWINSLWGLIITRGIMGACMGVISPFFVGYLGRLWSGETFKRLVGLKGTFGNVSTIAGSIMMGILAAASWHGAFYWYIIDIIIAVMIAIFVPSMPALTKEERAEKAARKAAEKNMVVSEADKKSTTRLYLLAVAFFFMWVLAFGVFTNQSLSITENGLGGTTQTSIASTLRGIVGAVCAVFYKELFNGLKKFFIPVMLVLGGIGMYLMAHTTSLIVAYIGGAVFGGAWGLAVPFFYHAANTGKKGGSANVKNAGIINVAVDLGSFMSAYLLVPVYAIFKASTGSAELKIAGGIMGAAGLIVCLISLFKRDKTDAAA